MSEPPRPTVRLRNPSLVLEVLGDCKRAALKADVSLKWWHEFRSTAAACLGPDATDEEHAKFLVVVKERFEVID